MGPKAFSRYLALISLLCIAFFSSSVATANPSVLNMVFVPASEKGDESDYESLIAIISTRVGVQIKPIKVIDYNAAVEAMRAGRAHLAWYGGKTYIKAAEIANAEAFAAGVRVGDTNAGYYSYFVVPAESPLTSLDDLRGKTLGLNSIGSTSGDLIPRVELKKAGISNDELKNIVYAGSHDACLLAALNNMVDVCGMSSRNFDARVADGTISASEVRIIHKSPLVPPPPLAYTKSLSQDLRDKIKAATLEAHKYGTIGGYGGEMSHYIAVEDSDYDPLRAIEKLLGK